MSSSVYLVTLSSTLTSSWRGGPHTEISLGTFMKLLCLHPRDTSWSQQGHPSPGGSQGIRLLSQPGGSCHFHRWATNILCLSCPSQVPEEMSRCRNSYTEQELKPLTLEALGRLCNDDSADYQHFLQDCVDSLFKEVKEKFKGWVSYSTSEQAELSYKKVSHILIFSHLSLVVGTWIH